MRPWSAQHRGHGADGGVRQKAVSEVVSSRSTRMVAAAPTTLGPRLRRGASVTRPRMISRGTTDAPVATAGAAPDDEQAAESGSIAVPSERHGLPGGRSRLRRAASVAAALGLLMVLTFAPLSELAGGHLTSPPVLPPDIGQGPNIPAVTSGLQD